MVNIGSAPTNWIIKLNDEDHPQIVLVEYFGMMAAHAAGLTVPAAHLSEDRQHLLVKRFDLTVEGKRLGFEDMCALLGLPAREKFTGSVERVIKTIGTYCQGSHIKQSYDHFFGQYLLASTIRNGDAHLKNFGLMYDEIKNAALAPTYDMLSMSVYAPQLSNPSDADDGLALNFEGSKRWLTPKTIAALANQCLVSTKRRNEWETQIAVALIETAKKVVGFVNTHPQDHFAKMAQRMLELWSIGLEAFDLEAAKKIRELNSKEK